MVADSRPELDWDALRELAEQADVVTIDFPLFQERFLIDLRSNETLSTFAGLVPPASSVQERFLWLGAERGELGMPEAFSFFAWPLSVRSLVQSDAFRTLRERATSGPGGAAERFDQAVQTLLSHERQALRAAIRGEEPWQTLWERPTL